MELTIQGLTINMLEQGDVVVAGVPEGWEKATLRIWCEHLHLMPPGHLALDVGAYTGIYSLLAQALSVPVFAFEPHPNVFQRLQSNGVIRALNVALSSTRGRMNMHITNDVLLPSGSSMRHHPTKPTLERVAVMVETGDKVVGLERPVGLIKLDVERHELQALVGMMLLIRAWRPVIIIECLDLYDFAQVNSLLCSSMAYKAQRIDDINDCTDDVLVPETGKTNFLFTPLA